MSGRQLLHEYVKLVLEMPHLELDSLGVSVVDFRIERLPVPPAEKQALMQAFRSGGFVGEWRGQDLVFSPDGARPVTAADAERPRLPEGWIDNAVFVE